MLRESLALFLQKQSAEKIWIIGLSGGADSLALFHALTTLVSAEQLVVAHLDHQLRSESAEEATFVANISAEWGVRCKIGRIDVRAWAKREQRSLEDAARTARYHFLAQVATEYEAHAVIVAHHADDQAETVLMRLLRGTGVMGLRGLQSVATVPFHPHLPLWRPLLEITRQQIELYCQEHQLQPRHDASNDDLTYFRNRIRHRWLPALAEESPQLPSKLCQLAEIVSAEDALMAQLTVETWHKIVRESGEHWFKVDLKTWRALPLALQRRVLRHGLTLLDQSVEVGFRPIEQARHLLLHGSVGAQTSLTQQWLLRVGYDDFTIAEAQALLPITVPQIVGRIPQPLPIGGRVDLSDHWYIEATQVDLLPAQPWDRWEAYLQLPIETLLWVRGRIAGDRIRPMGLHGRSTKLKEVMIDRKIPQAWREHWPLVVSDHHLVWFVGQMIDDRVPVREDQIRPIVRLVCKRTS